MFVISKLKGFTLFELVIVILLLGILAISLSKISLFSVSGYVDAKDRHSLGSSTKFITEIISRNLRESLPQSIRVGNSGSIYCVEYIHVENASTLIDFNNAIPLDNIQVAEFDVASSAAQYVVVMPITTNELYSTNLGVITAFSGFSVNSGIATINLPAPYKFKYLPPQNRIFLTNSPSSFCLDDNTGQLYSYKNYPMVASQPFPPTGGSISLMAENLAASGTVFTYQPGNLHRSGLFQMSFEIFNRSKNQSLGVESFQLFHEVHIRNVP
ncbi:MAG: type II secretion system GspH family protein [Gammaproteobacteria bacterium]|nr:type II secretion system GspH family protein [Gammaproteobacteria bacterium]MDH5628965.1 type II secretion system GspH family protein [Gammaproteobacteria bacterium]